MQTFFRHYLNVSMRVFAYLAGTLLFALVGAFATHIVPMQSVRWLIFFALNVIEFEIAGAIIARTYHPHVPPPPVLETADERETRIATEKMLYQMALFFVFDFVLAVGVALFGFHPPSVAYWVWGVAGLPLALAHFFGVALLAAGFYDVNAPRARTLAKITGIVFMLPGFVYIGIASWLFLRSVAS